MKAPGEVSYMPVPQPGRQKEEMVIHFDEPLQPPPVVVPRKSMEKEPLPMQRQTFPLPSPVKTETEQRASYVPSASAGTSIDDNGMGPFLSSLKMNRRKVLRSSDFVSY